MEAAGGLVVTDVIIVKFSKESSVTDDVLY